MGYRTRSSASLGIRRASALFVVALLVAPLTALAQSRQTLYLDDNGVPKAGMSSSAPAGALANFDPQRDDNAGLFLEPTSGGASENDSARHQMWSTGHNTIELNGEVSLVISAASAGGASDLGRVNAYLLDCPGSLRNCDVIDSGSATRNPWGTAWRTVTISFGSVDYELSNGRKLAVQITVDSAVPTGMHIAYAASSYQSRLVVDPGAAPTTTTQATTTTTRAATTTTQAATTTTQAATTTTQAATTTTQATTATTHVATTTTTPSDSGASATTTTWAATVPPTTIARYPGSGNALPPSSDGSGTETVPTAVSTIPEVTPSQSDPSFGDSSETAVVPDAGTSLTESLESMPGAGSLRSAEDILALVGDTPQPSVSVDAIESPPAGKPVAAEIAERSPVDDVVNVVELVLPRGAAQVAVSPLLVADALVQVLFRTGQGLSVPAAATGLAVGLLVVRIDRGAVREDVL